MPDNPNEAQQPQPDRASLEAEYSERIRILEDRGINADPLLGTSVSHATNEMLQSAIKILDEIYPDLADAVAANGRASVRPQHWPERLGEESIMTHEREPEASRPLVPPAVRQQMTNRELLGWLYAPTTDWADRINAYRAYFGINGKTTNEERMTMLRRHLEAQPPDEPAVWEPGMPIPDRSVVGGLPTSEPAREHLVPHAEPTPERAEVHAREPVFTRQRASAAPPTLEPWWRRRGFRDPRPGHRYDERRNWRRFGRYEVVEVPDEPRESAVVHTAPVVLDTSERNDNMGKVILAAVAAFLLAAILFGTGFCSVDVDWDDDDDNGSVVTGNGDDDDDNGNDESADEIKDDLLAEIDAEIEEAEGAIRSELESLKETIEEAEAQSVVQLKEYFEGQILVITTRDRDDETVDDIDPPDEDEDDTRQVAFPKSAAEAAALFGGDVSRWEPTADPGGWHLREEPFTTLVTPSGFLGEGYNDTKPGKNPDCYAYTVPIAVQGTTIWNEPGNKTNAEALQKKMAIPIWDDGQQHPCKVLAP